MQFIFIIFVLIMSVVIHEVSHGYAALALGDLTAKYQGRLTLNPISHLDPVGSVLVPLLGYFTGGFIIGWAKPVPYNPYNLRNARWGEAIVAAAGPASNILIALIFGILMRVGVFGEASLGFAAYVVIINITLALFNLMPIPPLDGSKILFAFLPLKQQGLREILERIGIVGVLIFVFVLWPFLQPAVAWLFSIFTGLVL
jgi:Zn-dependent protease